ncbi:MAG TPA: DUF211 domain-containing protein [Solirubrobacteraceae bacterium]|nr:DUF211 domain-containing protein [Solirubrobacteraceae bacterium]
MKIRRAKLDVDWALEGPGIVAVAEAVDGVPGVEAANVTITEIDAETVGSDLSVEGEGIDLQALTDAIERAGAVVHSIDQLVIGDWLVEHVPRAR